MFLYSLRFSIPWTSACCLMFWRIFWDFLPVILGISIVLMNTPKINTDACIYTVALLAGFWKLWAWLWVNQAGLLQSGTASLTGIQVAVFSFSTLVFVLVNGIWIGGKDCIWKIEFFLWQILQILSAVSDRMCLLALLAGTDSWEAKALYIPCFPKSPEFNCFNDFTLNTHY